MARKDTEKAALLAGDAYDNDATDYPSDADSADLDMRTSQEVLRDELEVFGEDYEDDGHDEKAPRGVARIFKRNRDAAQAGASSSSRQSRPSRRHRERKRRGEEESELVYEMEEGGEASQTPSERSSSESDRHRLADVKRQGAGRKARSKFICALIYAAIAILFLAVLYGAFAATRSTRRQNRVEASTIAGTFSNGTDTFLPTTILISLDGFRADFLQRNLTPTLNAFIAAGVSPLYMLPSFPSVTFPNHYTMATGLYPESHGIVGNTFWDPVDNEEFYYTHVETSMQPKWWGGDPLWATAEQQGVRTAVHMWPGSEAHIQEVEPTYLDRYNGGEALEKKVDRILGLIDLPGPQHEDANIDQPRPQLIAAYVPNVDQDGHLYGPNSTEIRQTIVDVDNMLLAIFTGLHIRNLTHIVNVVIVSDHGMATTDTNRLIQLEDIIDTNKVEHTDGWPLYGLRPKNPEDLDNLYDQVKANTKDNPNVEVYLRDKNMPARYHFSNNPRIAPLWIVPKAGWAIVTESEFNVKAGKAKGDIYHPRGLHGYDHEHPLMRAIFVARGPAFPHPVGSRIEVFQNTEVYNIVCDSIGIEPAPNNGTLRLPFKPVGMHWEEDAPTISEPTDPPTHTLPSAEDVKGQLNEAIEPMFSIATVANEPENTSAILAAHASAQAAASASSAASASASLTASADPAVPTRQIVEHPPDRPTIDHDDGDGSSKKTGIAKAWEWLTDKWDQAKEGINHLLHGDHGAKDGTWA